MSQENKLCYRKYDEIIQYLRLVKIMTQEKLKDLNIHVSICRDFQELKKKLNAFPIIFIALINLNFSNFFNLG